MKTFFPENVKQFRFHSQISIEECVEIFNSKDYCSLDVSDDHLNSKFITDISFLRKLKNLKYLSMGAFHLKNYEALNDCINLEYLIIFNAQKNIVDISNLNLVKIKLSNSNNIIGLSNSLKLTSLYWMGYPYQNIDFTENMNNLADFTICDSKIKNIEGLRGKKDMEYLIFRACPKLTDLSAISNISIKKLEINDCPKLNIDIMNHVSNVEYLLLIDSVKMSFIEQLKWKFKLRKFRYSYGD